MYAEVLVEYPVKSLDKSFTYDVRDFSSVIKVGMKVKVPFNNKLVNGIVLKIINDNPDYEVKKISGIENPEIYLNEEGMLMGKFLKDETLCPLISAYQTLLPSALKIKTNDKNYEKYESYIYIKNEKVALEYRNNNLKREKQVNIINELLKSKKVLKREITSSSLNTLIKNGIVEELKEKVYRINNDNIISNLIKLNDEQLKAYNCIKKDINKFGIHLIEGVTGSGKTEVYMNLIDDVISMGKSAIVLVPEICLTTQTVKRFYNRFGNKVAVFHSALSDGEKYDEYLKIYKGEVSIAVGTRSSIFVPFNNLGIVIIDEEHSDTYKQDSTPRYNAKNVAIFRCKYHNIPLVMASATPSMESKFRTENNSFNLVPLKKRANNMSLPKVSLVDMTMEVRKKNIIFSDLLKEKIQDRLDKNEQIILLLNRRGFSTFVSCSSCGYTYKCPNCDISLTYHKSTNNLRCHYCGYFIKKDDLCPECHEKSLNYLGLGTQKLEEELSKLYPFARIVRMDQDTTSKKGSYQRIIDDFSDFKYDILLGTQMISKGLDFKNVTLVGIINADTSLNIPDFRASEKTFDLLYQTSGRSGRDKKEGEVIIQTYNIDNPVLNYVKNNDYEGFYKYELNIRKTLFYPPYSYICQVLIKGKDYEIISKEANKIKKYLDNHLNDNFIIYGPSPASMFKINNIYNFNIIIKYKIDKNLKNTLKSLDDMYSTNRDVNLDITFNPSRF